MQTELLLFHCPECNAEVQIEEALLGDIVRCPNPECELPFRPEIPSATAEKYADEEDEERDIPVIEAGQSNDEQTILTRHPALFRQSPIRMFGLVSVLVLSVLGLFTSAVLGTGLAINEWTMLSSSGLLLLSGAAFVVTAGLFAVWYAQMLFETLIITSKRTIHRRGIVSRNTSEVQHDDVRNMQIDQNALHRILNVGKIAISSSGQDDLEIVTKGIANPEEIISIIRDMQ